MDSNSKPPQTSRKNSSLANREVDSTSQKIFNTLKSLSFFTALIVVGVFLKPSALHYSVAPPPSPLQAMFDTAAKQHLSERIVFWAKALLENPKLLAPFGKGPHLADSSPLFSENFDCTTFVETVGALAKSANGLDLANQLIAIRYKNSEVSFEHRNHFPELDWIPNNIASGHLQDITLRLAGEMHVFARSATKNINRNDWIIQNAPEQIARSLATIPLTEKDNVKAKIYFIPTSELNTKTLEKIPSGSVINIVRGNNPQKPVLITHQGILVQTNEGKQKITKMIHGSASHPIRSSHLLSYLKLHQKGSWPAQGININVFSEQNIQTHSPK